MKIFRDDSIIEAEYDLTQYTKLFDIVKKICNIGDGINDDTSEDKILLDELFGLLNQHCIDSLFRTPEGIDLYIELFRKRGFLKKEKKGKLGVFDDDELHESCACLAFDRIWDYNSIYEETTLMSCSLSQLMEFILIFFENSSKDYTEHYSCDHFSRDRCDHLVPHLYIIQVVRHCRYIYNGKHSLPKFETPEEYIKFLVNVCYVLYLEEEYNDMIPYFYKPVLPSPLNILNDKEQQRRKILEECGATTSWNDLYIPTWD
jgi:hypothetical protein